MRDGLSLHAVLDRLENARQRGKYWTARCPAHEDRRNSLSVWEDAQGSVALNCHAGCDHRSICAALRIEPGDLRAVGAGTGRWDRGGEIVATYDYRDASGLPRYQAVRLVPKSFRQRAPDQKGGWTWSMKGIERILYRLPEILKSDGSVFIVEGEQDADRLAAGGLVATCNVGGAGKWSSDYNKHLLGRTVFILPDNDAPGRDHAKQISDSLAAAGHDETYIVELPDLPEKGDVSDWLDHPKRSIDTLLQECAKVYDRRQPKRIDGLALEYIWAEDELLDSFTTGIWAIDRLLKGGINHGEICVLAAPPGNWKTTTALHFAYAACERVPVLFLSLEMSGRELAIRLLQYLTTIEQDLWRQNRQHLDTEVRMWAEGKQKIYVAEEAASVDQACQIMDRMRVKYNCEFVIIDYGGLLTGIGKDVHEQASYVSGMLRRYVQKTGITLLLLWQMNRDIYNRTKAVPKLSDLRNTGQVAQDADVVCFNIYPRAFDEERSDDQLFMHVCKNRNRGLPPGKAEILIDPPRQRFLNPQEGEWTEIE